MTNDIELPPYVYKRGEGRLILAADPSKLQRRLALTCQRVPAFQHLADAVAELSPLEALERFPCQDKTTLVTQGSDVWDIDISESVVMSETSGTTGAAPLQTPRSAEELRWNSRNIATAFSVRCTRLVDRVAILHPAIMSPFAEASGLALAQIGVPFLRVYPIPKVCSYQRLVDILRRFEITTVMTTPTLAYKLLWERDRLPLEQRSWSLRKYLLTGELITRESLQNMSRLGDGEASVFVYGSSEAATCFLGIEDGLYEPCLSDFVFELIPVADAEGFYDLQITWLNSGVRPLLRYRTGDLFRLHSHVPGRPGKVGFDAFGRTAKDGFTFLQRRRLDALVFGGKHCVFHYDLNVHDDRATLRIVTERDLPAKAQLEWVATLESTLRDVLGKSVDVVVNPDNHSFYDFSPTPKTTRIRIAK